jgi:HEAT repeat protein
LLYVWDESAAPAVVAGLDDEHWRPAEMCLKVSTKREIGEAGPRAAVLAVAGELPRVRVQALRTLGGVGDTEHVGAVRDLLHDPDAAVRREAARSLTRLARRLDLEVEVD